MEAIVLAGGFGTRLKSIVPDLPKPMAPIAGRPFLEILLTMLAHKGFKHVVLSLGFMSEKIISHFGNHYLGIELSYEVESTPLGTGGAIRASLKRCISDHIYIFNGDTYLNLEVDAIERLWQVKRNPVIVVREVEDTSRFGRVGVLDGRVTSFFEKGISGAGTINAGCYVFPKNALNDFELGHPFSIETDYLIKFIKRIRFEGFITYGNFIDIGVPEDYEVAQLTLSGI